MLSVLNSIYFFEKFLQEHYQSVKQVGSKLFAKIIYQQMTKFTASKDRATSCSKGVQYSKVVSYMLLAMDFLFYHTFVM